MTYAEKIANLLSLRAAQVQAVIEMLDEGNTIPFIARYRKERTDTLDEEQLRSVESWINKLRALDERRTTVLASIEEQGKLTDELRSSIATPRINPNAAPGPVSPANTACSRWRT